jgi:hypothetical protein
MSDDSKVAYTKIPTKALSFDETHWGRLRGVIKVGDVLFLVLVVSDEEYFSVLKFDTMMELEKAKGQLVAHIGKRVCVWPRNLLWAILGLDVVVGPTANSEGGDHS